MNCEYFKILISAGLDGELTEGEQTKLDRHLTDCHECAEFKDSFDEIQININLLETEDIPVVLENSILKETTKKRRMPIFEFLFGFYRIPRGALLVGLAIIAVIAFYQLPITVEPELKANISIQPAENILTVQKIVITEDDIIASSSKKRDKSI